jgi:hypothetical protein
MKWHSPGLMAYIRCFLDFCVMHPPRNVKFNRAGLLERRKRSLDVEARDIALTLFSVSETALQAVQNFKSNGNKQPSVRSEKESAVDADAMRLLFSHAKIKCPLAPGSTPQPSQSIFSEDVTDIVPRHLYDPDVYNDYPHCRFFQPPESDIGGDPWPELWDTLNRLHDPWFLNDPDTVMVVLRNMIYRLEWEAAVVAVRKCLKRTSWTFSMDSELTRIFENIGDASGAMCFKLSSGIYDGRLANTRKNTNTEQFNPLSTS